MGWHADPRKTWGERDLQMFPSREEAMKAKWFSRRHETATAHHEAVAAHRTAHSKDARRARAETRAEARVKRTPLEQLALLDARLGDGVGAFRERERLERMLSNG